MLSIIIPTLNAGKVLQPTLQALASAVNVPHEVIVADGGSIDDTAAIASDGEAIFLESQRGRGRQLSTGAQAAAGDWMLFLHAGTALQPGWGDAVAAFTAEPANRFRAAYFRFALDDPKRVARLLEGFVRLRSRLLRLPYGEQGLLISRTFYEQLGGYKALPMMEDVDIVRRIGRSQLQPLSATALSSADQYRRDGFVLKPLRNLLLLALYNMGVSTRYLGARSR